jgi:hypothetical protein
MLFTGNDVDVNVGLALGATAALASHATTSRARPRRILMDLAALLLPH